MALQRIQSQRPIGRGIGRAEESHAWHGPSDDVLRRRCKGSSSEPLASEMRPEGCGGWLGHGFDLAWTGEVPGIGTRATGGHRRRA